MEERPVDVWELPPRRREKVKGVRLALEEGCYSTMEIIEKENIPQRMLGDLGILPHIGPAN